MVMLKSIRWDTEDALKVNSGIVGTTFGDINIQY